MGTASDDVKNRQFRNFLEADSAADEWFDELDNNEKKDWNTLEAAFCKRWPRKKTAKKTTDDYEREITTSSLKMEYLGKKETAAGKEVYAHIAWADNMETIIRGAKLETATTYIGHVRRDLPKLLKEKIGTAHDDWAAFLQAVRDVDLDHIKEGVEAWKKEEETKKKEQDARKETEDALRRRIQQLEQLTDSPTAPLRQQMTMFSIGNPSTNTGPMRQQAPPVPSNPFVSNTGGRGNLFYAAQARPTHHPAEQPQAPSNPSR